MINIFVSYSHKDEIFKDELYSHLYPLTQNERYSVNVWIDTFIQPSDKWDDAIKEKLNKADIILLLVSADFLSSYYINSVEMQHAINKHIAGELIVIPIIVRHCDWKDEGSYISKIQAYPKDGKPVTDWLRKDEAYLDVILKLKAAINNILGKRKGQEIEDFIKRLDLLKEFYTSRYKRSVKALSVTPTLEETLLKLFEQSYYNTFNKLQELIDKFVPGDIIISFDQMKDFYKKMTDDTYDSFVALTHYKDWGYWNSPASKYWLDGNKDLIKRNRKVERTFVIESEETLLDNIALIDIIKEQISTKIKIKILLENNEVRRFFNEFHYFDSTTGVNKFRLGYVIYDEKYVSFWIEDAETEDEAKYEKRKLIIKLDKETVDKYNEMNHYFNQKSIHFDNLRDFEKWIGKNV